MVDLVPILFEQIKQDAKLGYEEDAIDALNYVMNYMEKSSIPENIKIYALEELTKIKNKEDAFFIKKKGKGKRPQKSTRERNLVISRFVLKHKYFENNNLRETPLTDEEAIGSVSDMEQPLSEQTIRDAYYEHKEILQGEADYFGYDTL